MQKKCKKENGHNNNKRRRVCRTIASALFGTIKACLDKYGNFDGDEESDVFLHPMEMSYRYTLDGHYFSVRAEGFPEIGDGVDVVIYNNGNVDITVYCYPYTTDASLIVFDEEKDIDSAVKQAREVIALLLESIVTGFSVYHLHRYLCHCNGSDDYTWKDALSDYKAFDND